MEDKKREFQGESGNMGEMPLRCLVKWRENMTTAFGDTEDTDESFRRSFRCSGDDKGLIEMDWGKEIGDVVGKATHLCFAVGEQLYGAAARQGWQVKSRFFDWWKQLPTERKINNSGEKGSICRRKVLEKVKGAEIQNTREGLALARNRDISSHGSRMKDRGWVLIQKAAEMQWKEDERVLVCFYLSWSMIQGHP